jgi:hypothetical protein
MKTRVAVAALLAALVVVPPSALAAAPHRSLTSTAIRLPSRDDDFLRRVARRIAGLLGNLIHAEEDSPMPPRP